MTFPLPLVAFEQYMLADDRRTYPMDYFFRLRFSGLLDRSALATALAAALSRNPLLSAVVRSNAKDRYEWVAWEGDAAEPCWLDQPPCGGYPRCHHIDLQREPGVRTFGWDEAGCSCLLLQFHHACCDGVGALQFIEDLCVGYANQTQGTSSSQYRSIDSELLAGRGRFGLRTGTFLRMLPSQAIGLKGVQQYIMRRPSPIHRYDREAASRPLPDAYPAAVTIQFNEEQTRLLRQLAVDRNVTWNDLLLAEVFCAVHEYQRRQGRTGDDWLRFTVPINLRGSADRRQSAVNVVGMVFLDRRPSQIRDPARLLGSIHDEMRLIRRHRLGLTSALVLGMACRVPGGLANAVRRDGCKATALVTNLGQLQLMRPPQEGTEATFGNVRITEVDILATFRPHTHAAFAVFDYANRQTISLHYDARVFTPHTAADLVNGLEQRLLGLIGGNATAVSGDH